MSACLNHPQHLTGKLRTWINFIRNEIVHENTEHTVAALGGKRLNFAIICGPPAWFTHVGTTICCTYRISSKLVRYSSNVLHIHRSFDDRTQYRWEDISFHHHHSLSFTFAVSAHRAPPTLIVIPRASATRWRVGRAQSLFDLEPLESVVCGINTHLQRSLPVCWGGILAAEHKPHVVQ